MLGLTFEDGAQGPLDLSPYASKGHSTRRQKAQTPQRPSSEELVRAPLAVT